MKAPDKIYLAESDNIKGEVTSNFASSTPFRRHSSIAYIRKDALLEWVEEEMMKAAKQSDAYGRRNAFMDVIDKLNSM